MSSGSNRKLLVAFVVLPAVIGVALFLGKRETTEQLLAHARLAAERGDHAAVEGFARQILNRDSDSKLGLLFAGQALAAQGRPEAALTYLNQVADDRSQEAVEARCAAGDILLLDLERFAEAEEEYLRALVQSADNPNANERLAYLAGMSSRSWESIPYQLRLIREGRISPTQLDLLCHGETVIVNRELVPELYRRRPDDVLVQLGMARVLIESLDYNTAEKLLRRIVESHPDLIEAQRHLGRVLLETENDEAFQVWHSQLRETGDGHPGIWMVRGTWASVHGEPDVAARCFGEACRIDPNQHRSNYQLAQALVSLGLSDEARPFFERAQALLEYGNSVMDAKNGRSVSSVRQAASQAESLGLLWEAYAWRRLALGLDARSAWAREGLRRLESRLPALSLARSEPEFNPAQRLDLSEFPLPRWSPMHSPDAPADLSTAELNGRSLVFRDEAEDARLKFTYVSGAVGENGRHIQETNSGGGIGVIDFDADGWPDVYLSQGCRWPPEEHRSEQLDVLYRNMGGGRFHEVAAASRIAEDRFGQGVAVGDVDGDGFADVYVGNIGENRLYHNNGDGTFEDATLSSGTGGGPLWTSSCLIADLNGDGLEDLYAVNYLTGEDVFERVCENDSVCHPSNFPAATDRLFVNLGDGRFADASADAGIEVRDGRGLGIVAADFDRAGSLNLFVANDSVPNFYFVNQTPERGAVPRFLEEALTRGLAVNGAGQFEACMGIAAGDADGDGLLDLYVTNFYQESNTLYRQQAGNLFTDETRTAGLHAASLPVLGFGAQFLDGDLDGDLDLMVANGHLQEFAGVDTPYEMPPLFFLNDGRGRFSEPAAELLGPYFTRRHVGRGLARIDWNRDGLDDLVVTHLDAPATLLTNATQGAGHFLALRLRGTASSRDAVGAVVEIKFGEKTGMRQLTAGDGFQVSNERRLVFGLGEQTHAPEIVVRWPSGATQTFADLAGDAEYVLVEQADRPLQLLPIR